MRFRSVYSKIKPRIGKFRLLFGSWALPLAHKRFRGEKKRFRNQSVGKPSYMGLSYFNPSLKWGKAWKKWNYGYIFLWYSALGKHLHKNTVSGLYFTKNRPETHFLRDFMIIWLSVELAGRAKIWCSHPQFRYWTSFFSDEYAFETNISLDFTFPGFTLLENDQKALLTSFYG